MGKLHFLTGGYSGKVGETTGAAWKGVQTVRAYKIPGYRNTPEQQTVRSGFRAINSFVARFSDQIRYLSALDTSKMSVRNAIVKLNGEMSATNTFDKSNLLVSKGGLQKVNGEAATATAGKVTVTWSKPTATNFTEDAKLVAIFIQEDTDMVEVATAKSDALTLESTLTFEAGKVDVYVYFLDKRGSNKVASLSDYLSVTIS